MITHANSASQALSVDSNIPSSDIVLGDYLRAACMVQDSIRPQAPQFPASRYSTMFHYGCNRALLFNTLLGSVRKYKCFRKGDNR